MAMIGKIRRMYCRDKLSLSEIAWLTNLSLAHCDVAPRWPAQRSPRGNVVALRDARGHRHARASAARSGRRNAALLEIVQKESF
jgi:hypothetical protein